MKNIHMLPTDKPSKLYKNLNGKLSFTDIEFEQSVGFTTNQHIYITNSEEIKEGDCCIITDTESVLYGQFEKHRGAHQRNDQWKKIILTTDQDLIKDGVQEIDDEFLEWFVKNLSCEEVEVNYGLFTPSGRQIDPMGILQNHSSCVWKYKIIIPKEEPKQETTLEEAAERLYPNYQQEIFIEGAKWQEEQDLSMVQGYLSANLQNIELLKRSYSEEEVLNLFKEFKNKFSLYRNIQILNREFYEWFEQFKKK